jgi:maleylpyruvate isomerase
VIPADLAPQDAARRANELLARVQVATASVLATAGTMTDPMAREPSLLPGWSRGHVLSHLARNADGLRNLLVWAHTGVETPQYPTAQARDEGIEAGAGRKATALAADVAESAAQFADEAAGLTDTNWVAYVHGVRGAGHPAWYTLWRRLSELEIHHVDLDLRYGPGDWPAEFASQCLHQAAERFTGTDSPSALLRSADDGTEITIGPEGAPTTVAITGPTRELLAWLLGRGAGRRLVTEPAGPLPPVPPW